MTYLCARHTVPTHTCWQQRTAIVLVWRADILYLMWMLHTQKILKKPKRRERKVFQIIPANISSESSTETCVTYTQGKEITAPECLGDITKITQSNQTEQPGWWQDRSVHPWANTYSLRISVPQPLLLQVPRLLHLHLILFEDRWHTVLM